MLRAALAFFSRYPDVLLYHDGSIRHDEYRESVKALHIISTIDLFYLIDRPTTTVFSNFKKEIKVEQKKKKKKNASRKTEQYDLQYDLKYSHIVTISKQGVIPRPTS